MSFDLASRVYVTEHRANGFSLYGGAFESPHQLVAGLAQECVKLGHRLALEGKDIEEVRIVDEYSHARTQRELRVDARIKFRLRKI